VQDLFSRDSLGISLKTPIKGTKIIGGLRRLTNRSAGSLSLSMADLEYPSNEGPTPRLAALLAMSNGKINK
jgi:hypothetical protein